MPGPLAKAHAKYEKNCDNCHAPFKKTGQDKLCLDCHDHENIKLDIKDKKGLHGRMPGVRAKSCNDCHAEHKGRDHELVLLDAQTFDHGFTDFPLRDAHSKVACDRCHKKEETHAKAKSTCVECHKEAEPHDGRLGKVCNSCHRENRWTDFVFDHDRTDFKLKGKHRGVICRDCHPQEQYSGVPDKCIGCHRADDKHKGRNGEKCADCHSEAGWSLQTFDHDKDSDFPLRDGHKKVHCDQCHKQPGIKDKPKTACAECHRVEDRHKGRYGDKCQDCHTAKGWGKSIFDHDKTDFRLQGKHDKLRCDHCHTGDLYKDKLSVKCIACHKQDDAHKGKQGEACGECHNERGWGQATRFDHDLSRFPLLGSHAALACEECHISSRFSEADIRCFSCHRTSDVHKRRLSEQCQRCHFAADWKVWRFDHDKQTDYPLRGAHKGIRCELCHKSAVAKDLKISTVCYRCHGDDDIHDGEFGRACDRCHDDKAFKNIKPR